MDRKPPQINVSRMEKDLMNHMKSDSQYALAQKRYKRSVAIALAFIFGSAILFVAAMINLMNHTDLVSVLVCIAAVILMIVMIIVQSIRLKRAQGVSFSFAEDSAREYVEKMLKKEDTDHRE